MLVILIMLSLVFTVFSQSVHDVLYEGDSKRFGDYELKLLIVSDRTERVVFSLNSELSGSLRKHEQHRFSDGSLISITDIIPNEAGEKGGDFAEFFFLPATKLLSEKDDPTYDLSFMTADTTEDEENAKSISKPALADLCTEDKDCHDSNACTIDTCGGRPKTCTHNKPTGCPLRDSFCLPFNQTTVFPNESILYCDTDAKLKTAKAIGVACKKNIECQSRNCSGVCKERTSLSITPELNITEIKTTSAPIITPSIITSVQRVPETNKTELNIPLQPIQESPAPVKTSFWNILASWFDQLISQARSFF